MSKKHFTWLFLATFVVGAVVLFLPQQTARDSITESGLLVPGLEARVNDIDWLQLTAAGNRTVATLERKGGSWTVEEASGYSADWDQLRSLLSGLSQARILEAKTANPDYYDRLGVQDVNMESAAGVMISFPADSGLPRIIVGAEARGRAGQYVRLAESAESALIDTALDVPGERSAWLETSIVDISNAEVVEVRITHPGGTSVRAVKASADDENFQLQEVPEGREVKSEWSVNALGNALAGLELDDVVPQAALDWTGAGSLYLLTADGLAIEVATLERPGTAEGSDSEFWISLEAQLYTTALGPEIEEGPGDAETRSRAEAINERVRGWAYRIPQYKFNSMALTMDELLKEVSEPSSL